jgi:hypothetical protein
MAVNFLNHLNLNKNELQNAVIQPLATAPINPLVGQIYYNGGSIYVCTVGGASPTWKSISGDIESVTAGTGLTGGGTGGDVTVSLKNTAALTANTLVKWDSANGQLVNSLITDDGTTVTIAGNVTISGTTTTVNTETITVNDNIIVLNNNSAATPTENAGIEVERGSSANVSVLWNETTDRWTFTNDGTTYYNIPLSTEYNNYVHPTGDGNLHVPATGTTNSGKVLTAGATAGALSWEANIAGQAGTALKWTTARTITLGGDLTGNVSIDGSANVTLTATIAANSVALGTDTTGNYVAGVTAGQGITVTGTAGEGWSPTVALSALDLTLFPTASFKKSVRVATTANITLSATQTIDGIAVAVGDRVLVKNQTTASQNGIYVVAAAAWTRATDADISEEIASAIVCADEGTANGGKHFTNTFKRTDTLNTTAMPWYAVVYENGTWAISISGSAATLTTARTINGTSFNGSANITTATWGTTRSISIGGTAKNVDGSANVTWATSEIAANTAVTLATARTLTIGNTGKTFNGSANVTWSLTEIGVPAAIDDAFTARTYKQKIGDGTATDITVTHNLNTQDVIVQLYDSSSFDTVYADVVRTDPNFINVSFTQAPALNDISVLIFALP